MKYYIKAWNNYANFEGRSTRTEYWYFVLFNFLISFSISILDQTLNTDYLRLIYSLIMIVPNISINIRRMHDTNHSGWFCLIPIYSFILACTKSDEMENEYGKPVNDDDDTPDIHNMNIGGAKSDNIK